MGYITSYCRDPAVHYPCVCVDNEISCRGHERCNLTEIFRLFDQKLDENEKHFKSFILDNTTITELDENTFYDITFDEIAIFWNRELRFINSNTFGATRFVTKRLNIEYNPIENSPPDYDFFQMLNSMKNVHIILGQHLNITEIPSYAFGPDIGNNLTFLGLPAAGIEKIGNYAFYELNNLEELDLDHNTIHFIPENAFTFKNYSDKNLLINLEGMYSLNSTGFEIGSLSNIKRPTILKLKSNENITYLKEEVFKPFFEANVENRVQLTDSYGKNGIDCNNCKNYWLKKELKYFIRTDLIKCSNGKYFEDRTNFNGCQ